MGGSKGKRKSRKSAPAAKAWSGRFSRPTDPAVERFTESISFDWRLFREDIAGSVAHARMLKKQGYLTAKETAAIVKGLEEIRLEMESGRFLFREDREDIHLNIEAALIERVGDAARKLHTGRSRNDQVATDLRLWLKRAAAETDRLLAGLQRALVALARRGQKAVLPGYTHLRPAQPLTGAHYLLSLVEAFARDRRRLKDLAAGADVCPLGSGALAGSSLRLDRRFTARELGFKQVAANSLDAVSDRDFCLEFLAAAGIAGTHLTRLAEDWIIFSGPEFGFLRLPEPFTTGSSIMPQKANPDVLELIRAKGARLTAAFGELATLLKGLPSGYNRDLQEDKLVLFQAADSLAETLEIAGALARGVRFDDAAGRRALAGSFAEATILAEHLVERGTPFRTAHHLVGRLVRLAESSGRTLAQIPAAEMRRQGLNVAPGIGAALAPGRVDHYRTAGSAAPGDVERQLRRWEKTLGRG